MMAAIAHTENRQGQQHDLVRHLLDVAETARGFADVFGEGELAYLLGLWHDLGKFNPKFQDYLRAMQQKKPHPKVPHAIWGAALAYELLAKRHEAWLEIALSIAGHHTGLHPGGK